MIDLVQAQAELVSVLLSAQGLQTINTVSYRKMRISGELDYRSLLTTARNGKAGAGIIVLMPTAADNNPSVSGPVLGWTFGIVILEMDAVNMNATTGTLIASETITQIVMDILHLFADELLGTFNVDRTAVQDEKEYVFPGCIGYRINLILSSGRTGQTPRVSALQCSVNSVPVSSLSTNAGTLTILTATPNARIVYTTDGSFPTDTNGDNPVTQAYGGPFVINSGDTIRVVGYADGMINSAARYFTVN